VGLKMIVLVGLIYIWITLAWTGGVAITSGFVLDYPLKNAF